MSKIKNVFDYTTGYIYNIAADISNAITGADSGAALIALIFYLVSFIIILLLLKVIFGILKGALKNILSLFPKKEKKEKKENSVNVITRQNSVADMTPNKKTPDNPSISDRQVSILRSFDKKKTERSLTDVFEKHKKPIQVLCNINALIIISLNHRLLII